MTLTINPDICLEVSSESIFFLYRSTPIRIRIIIIIICSNTTVILIFFNNPFQRAQADVNICSFFCIVHYTLRSVSHLNKNGKSLNRKMKILYTDYNIDMWTSVPIERRIYAEIYYGVGSGNDKFKMHFV